MHTVLITILKISLQVMQKKNRHVASVIKICTQSNYFGDGTRVPRLVETSLVMLVSTKDACSSQRRVLRARAMRWKNESKYRACGAGGPDKIKQLFPRFIGSAVNRHDRLSRFTSSSLPLFHEMHSSRAR